MCVGGGEQLYVLEILREKIAGGEGRKSFKLSLSPLASSHFEASAASLLDKRETSGERILELCSRYRSALRSMFSIFLLQLRTIYLALPFYLHNNLYEKL